MRCRGYNQTGKRCKKDAAADSEFCHVHDRENECCICLKNMKARSKHELSCAHAFHRACILKWEKQCLKSKENIDPTCPICRDTFSLDVLRDEDYIPEEEEEDEGLSARSLSYVTRQSPITALIRLLR